jgi:exodeoxyribonuclease VII large subunit
MPWVSVCSAPPSSLLARHQARVTALQQHLTHLDPRAVLARGYSITRHADGRIARSVTSLSPGTAIYIEVHDGTVAATVDPVQGDLLDAPDKTPPGLCI